MANLTNKKDEFAIAIFRHSPPSYADHYSVDRNNSGNENMGFFGNPHKNESRRGSEDERFRGPGQEDRNIGGEEI